MSGLETWKEIDADSFNVRLVFGLEVSDWSRLGWVSDVDDPKADISEIFDRAGVVRWGEGVLPKV